MKRAFVFFVLILSALAASPALQAKQKSSSCNVCKDLCLIKHNVKEVEEFLEDTFPCNPPIAIKNVPITISEPGKYCVTSDLVYTGSDAAISVVANNVTINFHNHDLILTNSNAIGILAQNVRELVIENDQIKGTSLFKTTTSAAIHLVNVNKATVDNIFTQNTTRGIFIEDSNDIFIKNSHLKFHEGTIPFRTNGGAGVFIDNSAGISVDNCVFEGANITFTGSERNFGIIVLESSRNVSVINSSFTGWFSALHFDSCTGVLVDNCEVIAADTTPFNISQFGNVAETEQANDVIVRNSTFVQKNLVPGFDGLLLIQGNGFLFENVIIDLPSTTDSGYLPGAFHIGCAANGGCDPTLAITNVLALNCTVRGQNDAGLYVENGFKCTFDNCQFTDATLENVLLQGANSCIIKNSSVTDATGTGHGIVIQTGANNNAVVNCEVIANAGSGIIVDSGALNNHLRGNSVFDNGDFGIDNNDSSTETYFNTSCNNGGTNCDGVTPAQNPGDSPAVAGSNVCCGTP